MSVLPDPLPGAIIYQDDLLYVCLANYPLSRGHCVVVWKDDVADLHLLHRDDYEHLMDVVDQTRNALIEALGVEKVYLMYLDEANHVHWHLVPRYDEKGFNVLQHKPNKLTDTSLADTLKQKWHELV